MAALDDDARTLTVAARIRGSLDRLTAKEKQVARVVLSRYPAAGLETTAALSVLAHVSGPTVVRFVTALGYGSYREFQSDLRNELEAKTASPTTRVESATTSRTSGSHGDLLLDALATTLAELPSAELEAALDLLADRDARIHVLGGRFSRLAADYLVTHLEVVRAGVHLHRSAADLISALPTLRSRDCLVVFDYRRYQADTIAVARLVKQQRGRIVLLTDPWMSPIAEFADVVLPSRVDSVSPLDSHLSTIALVELLVGGAFGLLGDSADARLTAIDGFQRAAELRG